MELAEESVDVERDAAQPEVLRLLVEHRARFVSFVERRVGRRDLADEIVQEAFLRRVSHAGSLRKDESAVAWFYRVLRNAIIDHHRHADAERRALAAVAVEPNDDLVAAPDQELMDIACACVVSLLDTLKPEYAAALKRVDVEGANLARLADEAGITANNAAVRLHRARQALRRQVIRSCGTCSEHGCLGCQCRDESHQAC